MDTAPIVEWRGLAEASRVLIYEDPPKHYGTTQAGGCGQYITKYTCAPPEYQESKGLGLGFSRVFVGAPQVFLFSTKIKKLGRVLSIEIEAKDLEDRWEGVGRCISNSSRSPRGVKAGDYGVTGSSLRPECDALL